MTSTRLSYVRLSPEKAFAALRTIFPSAFPSDVRPVKIGYDKETDYLVLLLESAAFAEVSGPEGIPEILLE
jgi:hypothetical protein